MTIYLGLCSLVLIFGASASVGALIWRLMALPCSSSLLWEVCLGFGVTGYLLLGLAALGQLNWWVVVTVLGLLSFLNLVIRRSGNKRFFGVVHAKAEASVTRWEWVGWAVVFFILVMAILEALAPATTEDTISYHFRIPYDYVVAGKLIYSPSHLYNMPHLMEMMVTVPFLLDSGDVGAHLVYFVFCILLTAAVVGFTSQYVNKKTALLAAVLLLSTPMVSYIKVSGMVEVALTTMIMLGIWAMLNGLNDEERYRYRWLFVSGVFVGLACGIKYYGLFVSVAAFIIIAVVMWREYGPLATIKGGIVFLIGVMLFGFPFYAKNFVMTGNPLYPAMFNLFGGRDWSTEMDQASKLHFDAYKRPAGNGLLNLLLSPWRLTMDGERFLAGRTGYGFIYLALCPLLLCRLWRCVKENGLCVLLPNKSMYSVLAWFIAFFWVLWFLFAFQRGRHLMPVFSILSVMTAAISFSWLAQAGVAVSQRIIRGGVAAVLLMGISFQLLVAVYFTAGFVPVAIGAEDSERYLKRIRPMWEDYQWANENLPAKAKVLHLNGDWQYYLKREQFYPSPYFQGWVDWATIPDVQSYRNQLIEAGFTHVISGNLQVAHSIDNKIVDRGSNNIYRFNELNVQLIKNYAREVYNHERIVPCSRTTPSGNKKTKFVVYELI